MPRGSDDANVRASRLAFAQRVKQVRDEAGYRNAGELAKAAVIAKNTASSACNGKKFPRRNTISAIAAACETAANAGRLDDWWLEVRDAVTVGLPSYGQPWPADPGASRPAGPEEVPDAEEARQPLEAPEPPHRAHHPEPSRHGRRSALVVTCGAALAAVAVVTVVALVSRVGDDDSSEVDPAASRPASVPFTFDVPGGVPGEIIQVYAGPGESPEDMALTGTFRNGDVATARCASPGRTVTYDAPGQVPPRSSSTWVMLDSPGGLVWFATAAFSSTSSEALQQLPAC